MEKLDDNKKIVKKVLVDRMLKYLNDFSYSLNVYDDTFYQIDLNEYEKLINRFLRIINHNLINEVSHIKEADLSRLDSLYEEHKSYFYENVRTKFNLLDKELYSDEEIINSGLMVLAEVENIKKIPKLIKSISSKLDEVKVYELTPTVDVLSSKFKEMKKNGASYKDYALLNDNLDNIIRKTYVSNVSKLSSINNDYDLALVVSEDEGDYHLLTNDNIELFTCGYIYKPEDIISASNDEDDHKFLSYEHLDKKNNVLNVSGKPIGIYALTIGNKSLSSNYKNALRLASKNRNLELIEIDVTKYASKDILDDYKRMFIDELLENKNISINTSKDKDFYNRFDYFFDKYILLKGSRYDEENIINLFDFYFNIIYSQKYDNLDYLFSGALTLDEVGEVLSQNIYHQDNIFRYNQVDEKMVERFISKYGAYYNNEVLNKVYPGVDVIIEKLSNASSDELSNILEVVNSTYKMDSWLISQMLEPTHVISREYAKTEVKTNKYIDSDFYGDFKSFLQSNDDDNQRRR